MESEIKDLRRRLEGELNEKQELEHNLELRNRQVAEMKEIGRKIVEY